MDPKKRTLLRVELLDAEDVTKSAVDALMGTKPEARFRFIQERAEFASEESTRLGVSRNPFHRLLDKNFTPSSSSRPS